MRKPYLSLKHAAFSSKPNALLIPVTNLHYTKDNVRLFNSIYFYLKNKPNWSKIKRTPSGAISNDHLTPSERFNRWDLRRSNYWIEITIIEAAGMWRIHIGPGKDEDKPILSGHQAFFVFENFIKKFNITMKDYAIENGELVNRTIEKPLITLEHEPYFKDKIFAKAHHIDFHSSYPAGLVNTHPEFKEGINYLYDNRNRKPEYKDLLNYTIGFFHSKWCGYKYAQLAKDAISDSNKRVIALAQKVQRAGRTIILFNTDGFWYSGEEYHGEGEGTKLGEWSNDHLNCKFRAKSAGAYEYIENELYTPVLRGSTMLDRIKNRDKWEWGDIYKQEAIVELYEFNEEKGVYEV